MLRRWRELDDTKTLKAIFWLMTASFLAAALLSPDRAQMLAGMKRFYTTVSQTSKDYFAVGGVSASFANAFTIALLCTALYCIPGTKLNGTAFLAFTLTVGFAFWGMNLFNLCASMTGVLLYCLVRREKLCDNVNFMLFSTGIAPLMTDLLLRYPGLELHGYTAQSVLLTLAVGAVVGFFTPIGCKHSPNVHKGYCLYSAALPLGLMAIFLRGVLYTLAGAELPQPELVFGQSRPGAFYGYFLCLFALFTVLGGCKGGFRQYGKLLRASGYRQDMIEEYGMGTVLVNAGIFGLFLILYYSLTGGNLNGIVFGQVLCMVCAAMAGSHPGNVWPILLGYAVASFGAQAIYPGESFPLALSAPEILVGVCYANGLSPVTGKFGWFAGLLAGSLHYIFVTSIPLLHGSFLFYNGGFTACLVSIFLIPLLECFVKHEKR